MTLNEFIDQVLHHYDYVAMGAFLGFLITVYTFYKQVGIPMYKNTVLPIVNLFSAIANSPIRLNNVEKRFSHFEEKLDTIIAELRPNGGSSLKDQMNRLEANNVISTSQRQILLDIHTGAVWVSDKEGNCTWANKNYMEKTGATIEDFKGNNWIKLIASEDRNRVQAEWFDSVKEGRDFDLEYSLVNLKSGIKLKVHGRGTPIKKDDGTVLGYNGIISFL